MIEVWRSIPSLPAFEASSSGRVRRTATGHIFEPDIHRYGNSAIPYWRVRPFVNGRRIERRIGPLVCEAFHGSRPAKHHAAHENGDSLDDRATNLSWKTAQGNIDDRERHGRTARGTKVHGAKLTPATVRQIRRLLAQGHLTQRVIAHRFGVGQCAVFNIGAGKTWRHVA